MKRAQYIWIGAAAVLFAVVNWGLERRPPEMREGRVGGAAPLAATSAQALLREAFPTLDARDEAEVHGLQRMFDAAESDARRREVLEELSATWYALGHPGIAGHYAEEIAELTPTDTAWGIAATTYTLCLRADSLAEKQRAFCGERAVAAYENAISLAPDDVGYRVNLALHYADNPPADNPMAGIRMLLSLNEENPDDVTVLVQLGRLALRTNQNDKAVARLTRAATLDPDSRAAHCYLAEAAARTGDDALAATSLARCEALAQATPPL